MDKAKVLFVGDLVVPTGFSTVLHNIISNLIDDFDVIGLGVNYRGDPHNYKFPIFPASTNPSQDIYGVSRLVQILGTHSIDIVFILNDAWVISYYLDAIKKSGVKIPKIVVYFPVDSEKHDHDWYKDFDIVTKAVTYTAFGKRVVNECVSELNVDIIPHGVESESFYKIDDTKQNIRGFLYKNTNKSAEEFKDLFIVLNANRNQPRKRLDVTMKGFSLFAVDKPDVRLYMHSGIRDVSMDLAKLAVRYGIENKLILTNNRVGVQSLSVPQLNLIYNACDVGINTCLGEGWGLTNVEHAVTGAAQVVPNHSACAELFEDAGYLTGIVSEYTFDNVQTVGKLTSPEEVAKGLNILYYNKELREQMALSGMNKFTRPEYQWKNIAQTWKKLLLEVVTK